MAVACLHLTKRTSSSSYKPMEIRIESRFLDDVVVVVPDAFRDALGFFMETFREDQFQAHGLPTHFHLTAEHLQE
jgi:dTDP-4-dehydrorhamnose 3,5-epimerase-like enzyme